MTRRSAWEAILSRRNWLLLPHWTVGKRARLHADVCLEIARFLEACIGTLPAVSAYFRWKKFEVPNDRLEDPSLRGVPWLAWHEA